MKVTMLLCDAAQAVNGKLYVLGGGWDLTGPKPSPSALAIHVAVPWDEANRHHRLRLALVTDDGQPVLVPGPDGEERPMEITADFEVGRPPGHRAGTPLPVALGINIAPLPLKPGSRYEWHCSIDDRTDDDWRLAFSTRPAAGAPQDAR
jgi:uncharacterized protein DUF6941